MKKRGFTIVELVIVIAVIAILAAVLVPTFSNVINKANYSADMQACREMNMALAEEEAKDGYVKPTSVSRVMTILANHGYDAANWQPLSSDYKFLWDSETNQIVLVLKADGTIVYPDAEGYASKGLSAVTYGAGQRFQEYNQEVIAAFNNNFSFSSNGNTSTTKIELNAGSSTLTETESTLASAVGGSAEQQNAQLKAALNISGNTAYVAASSTTKSSNATSYAACESLYVTDDEELVITADLLSTGEYTPNLYIISVNYGENATAEEKLTAQKAAGEYVYSLFVQMNAGSIDNSASVLIPAGTVINCSDHEWRAVKTMSGYFGTPDASNPVIIDGMKLSTDTGYAQTYTLKGSGSQYFLTGFIGTVYGSGTVENLTFKNVSIQSPGADYNVAAEKANRNTVAIIGGIIPDPATGLTSGAIDVTIRNITVESSCNITGTASVGGIVGYIGAEDGYQYATGSVTIENCKFAGTVKSLDGRYIADGYSPVGGIIGFTCRCTENITITVNNCEFTGNAWGYGQVGGLIGQLMNGKLIVNESTFTGAEANIGNCTYPVKKDGKTPTNYANFGKLGKLCGGTYANGITVDAATVSNSDLTYANAQGSDVAITGLSK